MSLADLRPRRAGAFTLIEMMAVMVLISIVFLVAIDFYLDLSRASNAAAERTRDGRRATAVLDRVARDLSSAALVRKPPAVDPLAHPWLFLAEGGNGLGADRLKFVSRGRRPRSDVLPESDLEMVAWVVSDDGFGERSLWRWSAAQLPQSLDRDFPRAEEPGVQLVAESLADFGVRFLNEDGEWVERWDSSLLIESSELPIAAEISVAFADPDAEEFDAELPTWQRRVLIPSQPLDLEALLDPEGADAGGDEQEDEEGDSETPGASNCFTVGQCRAAKPELFERLQPEVLDSIESRCVAEVGIPEDACR